MLVLTMISSDCRLPGHSLQLDRELQSTSDQLAHAIYKQILNRYEALVTSTVQSALAWQLRHWFEALPSPTSFSGRVPMQSSH